MAKKGDTKSYIITTKVVFVIVALLHLLRAINNLPLIIGTWEFPVWLSWVAFIFAGALSVWAFKLLKH